MAAVWVEAVTAVAATVEARVEAGKAGEEMEAARAAAETVEARVAAETVAG